MSLERARGALLGLACGDALGRPVEFKSAATIAAQHGRVADMLADGTHGQPAGTVTDDTDLALCIARSLVERGAFDPADVADRYVAWLADGPFDVGLMTAAAIRRLRDGDTWDEAGRAVWESRPEGQNAGNGSLMCCAPYALAFDPPLLDRVSRLGSAITHYDLRCRDACVAFNRTVAALVDGADAGAALDAARSADVHEAVAGVLDGLPDRDPDALSNSGFVVHTLETDLYHGLTAPDAGTAVCDAVAMGGDTDTIGAVAGAVAGARFGVDALPERWLSELAVRSELASLAADLHEGSFDPGPAAKN